MKVPDYNDLLDAYEAEREKRLARCPICASCGEPIQDEYLYDIDDNLYHEECVKELYRQSTENYER